MWQQTNTGVNYESKLLEHFLVILQTVFVTLLSKVDEWILLRLLLSPDATGHAAVGRVKDLPDLHGAMVQLSQAIESFSSRSDEVRRLGKELKAAVEGVSSSKTD